MLAFSSVILQLTLPAAFTPRYSHVAAMFGCGPSFRVVVLFGGNTTGMNGDEISDTTLLLLSEYTH